MVRGRVKIKGTKDFLVAAVFCAFLCLWSIRDAWFPTKKVLEKHPLSVAVAMKVPGVIKSLPLKPGEEIQGESVLASIYDETYKKAVAAAEAEFTTAKETREGIDEALENLTAARADLKACTLKNTDITQKTSHGDDVLRGMILEHVAKRSTHVEAGDTVLFVRPHDTFYLFNKSLAILSFSGLLAALIFHRIASR